MADEDKTEEEVKTDEAAEDTQEELEELHSDFDKLASDDDDPADDDGDEQTEEEDSAEEEKTVEKKDEKTEAKEDPLEAEMKAIEDGSQKKADEDVTEKAEKPAEKQEKEVDEPEKFVSKLDPEEWDKDAIERDTELGQKHLDAINAEKDKNAKLTARLDQQDTDRYTDWVDSKFSRLDDDFTEIFGEGDFDDIEPGSEQFDNRAKVVNRMNLISQAHQNMKKPVPSRNKLFQSALQREFKDKIKQPSKDKETGRKLAARKKQVIGKGSKKTSALSADERLNKVQRDFDALRDDE